MNIAITGANGFLGKILQNHFSQSEHKVHCLTRENIDLLDRNKVGLYFLENDIDVIFHTAITGGRRTRKDSELDFYNNIKMFEILDSLAGNSKIMFNFASGAEYDRSRDIFFASEKDLGDKIPLDFYGLSKYIISSQAINSKNSWVNLRIFNCFGVTEKDDRMIKGSILKKLNGEKIIVHQNRYMDFFHKDDLLKVVDFYLDNISQLDVLPNDINLSYGKNSGIKTLYSIAEYIDSLEEPRVGVEVEKAGYSKSYCGNNSNLRKLNLKLDGIKKSIRLVYNDLKNNNDGIKSYSEEHHDK